MEQQHTTQSPKNAGQGEPSTQGSKYSIIYDLIMTPVNFVTFIISLILVDIRYSHVRLHSHAQAQSRLPTWLHELLYRPQPYENDRRESPGRWYYHSNQKKLIQMEAEDAFKLRSSVLVLFGLTIAASTAGIWYVAGHASAWWHG